ncbi:unnamed protein product [Dovyalis caffra]|uniref:VQ domain-containing protein n=1 Tax=Dovyalis caffra TaxID=77055 RepID=A0AAV1QY39_9ROSI|nr:unnamed protein product [Dovyalis caffra]
MNGPRPSPLKINNESHLIHKSYSSSFSSSNSSSSISIIAPPVVGVKQKQQQQKNQPVIIYTNSPKVIHTQAKDFMALVQKLTGLSRSNNQETAPPLQERKDHQVVVSKGLKSAKVNSNERKHVGNDDNESSSVSTEENCHGDAAGGVDTVISPILKPPNAPYFADVPLFTPSSDFYCAPRPVFRCPDSVFASPRMGNPISPSLLEFMKGLPEY